MTFDIGLHKGCARAGGGAGVRYVITKFSRMDSLPNFLTHGAPLRARFARELRYKSTSVHPLLGVWILDGTVCVVFKKYYFTLSLPFKQTLVFRLCCDVQNVVSIILSTQYRFFLRFFSFFDILS